MSWVRKLAAVMAAVQVLAGSAAMVDVFGPTNGAKIVGVIGVLLGMGHAFLSAYQRPGAAAGVAPASDAGGGDQDGAAGAGDQGRGPAAGS